MKATYIRLNVAIPPLSHSQNTQRRSKECAYPCRTFSWHHITQALTWQIFSLHEFFNWIQDISIYSFRSAEYDASNNIPTVVALPKCYPEIWFCVCRVQAVTPHPWQPFQHSIHRYNLIKVYSQQGYSLEHTFFPDEWHHEWCPVLCHTSFHYVLRIPETYAVEYPLPLFHGQWTNIHGHFLQVPVEFEKYLQQQNKQSELQCYSTPLSLPTLWVTALNGWLCPVML